MSLIFNLYCVISFKYVQFPLHLKKNYLYSTKLSTVRVKKVLIYVQKDHQDSYDSPPALTNAVRICSGLPRQWPLHSPLQNPLHLN